MSREHVLDLVVDVFTLEDAAALGVDHLALTVQHVVVLQDVLAGLEVLRLDLTLSALDGVGDHLRLDGHVVRNVEAGQEGVDDVALEQPHEVVLERQVEARLTGVALTTGTTAQLVVDAT